MDDHGNTINWTLRPSPNDMVANVSHYIAELDADTGRAEARSAPDRGRITVSRDFAAGDIMDIMKVRAHQIAEEDRPCLPPNAP